MIHILLFNTKRFSTETPKWKYVHRMETEYFDIVAGVQKGDTLAP